MFLILTCNRAKKIYSEEGRRANKDRKYQGDKIRCIVKEMMNVRYYLELSAHSVTWTGD